MSASAYLFGVAGVLFVASVLYYFFGRKAYGVEERLGTVEKGSYHRSITRHAPVLCAIIGVILVVVALIV